MAHIVPEWYFSPVYAILRCIRNKLGCYGLLLQRDEMVLLTQARRAPAVSRRVFQRNDSSNVILGHNIRFCRYFFLIIFDFRSTFWSYAISHARSPSLEHEGFLSIFQHDFILPLLQANISYYFFSKSWNISVRARVCVWFTQTWHDSRITDAPRCMQDIRRRCAAVSRF